MALVRILVDGYSLLHSWPELAPGRARHSEVAREALISILTQYHDACGTPITIFFDGVTGPKGAPKSKSSVEVLFSSSGQTADQLIERAAFRFADYGEVLVVSDDNAERDTVHSVGGLTSSCANFVATVEQALSGLSDDLKEHNLKEKRRFERKRTK